MTNSTWPDLLKNEGVVGGDLSIPNEPLYLGNITRFRDYGDRITFHFTWAARKTQRGWTKREVRKITLRKQPLQVNAEGTFLFGSNSLYLRGKGILKESEVIEQWTHRDRKRAAERRKLAEGPDLFER